MLWSGTNIEDGPLPGILKLNPRDLLTPLASTTTLRSLDDLTELQAVLLDIIFLFAVLSIIPTFTFLVSTAGSFSQNTTATSWLLAEVLDPIRYAAGAVRSLGSLSKAPVKKGRLAVVGAVSLLVMALELLFIIGQAKDDIGDTELPITQIRHRIDPATNGCIDSSAFRIGPSGFLYAFSSMEIAGRSASVALPFLTLRQATDIPASELLASQLKNPASARATFQIRGSRPVSGGKTTGGNAPILSVQSLAPVNLYVSPIQEFQDAVDSVARATETERCNWEASDKSGDQIVLFSVSSAKEECYKMITADEQETITSLLGRVLCARIRVGGFAENSSRGLVNNLGAPIGNGMVSGYEDYKIRLKGTRQLVPNLVLISLAGMLVAFALLRAIWCTRSVREYAERDYAIVAEAFGWDGASSFARVSPEGSTESLLSLRGLKCIEYSGDRESSNDSDYTQSSDRLRIVQDLA